MRGMLFVSCVRSTPSRRINIVKSAMVACPR